MKKIILVFTIMLFTASIATAQSRVYFGAAGSFLSTWTTNQNNYGKFEMDYAMRMGFGGNITIGFDFNDNLGLKTELGWTSLGQDYKDSRGDTNYRRDIKLNYLQVPLMFKYRSGGDVVKFFVALGPQLNFLMNAEQTYMANEMVFTDTITTISGETFSISQTDITDRYMSMDVMARFDVGAEINLTKNLFLDANLTFGYGLLDINAEDFRLEDSSGEYHPSHNIYGGLQVGIHYAIPVGK